MILKKNLPSNGELVLIKVSKIMQHGAYCELVEYHMDAYLPISEISTGWIKNIHEFIKEGQNTVAKVISVDPAKRAVDISLKKATSKEKSNKIAEYSLEKRYEKLFEQAVASSGLNSEKEKLKTEIASHVQTYNELINSIVETGEMPGVKDPKLRSALQEIVAKNIKPKRYVVSYTLELKSSDPKGGNINTIKEALGSVESSGVDILYLGAPRYKLTSEDSSYPKAESRIKESQKKLEKYSKILSFALKSERP